MSSEQFLWFRRAGLPLFVPPRRRASGLAWRAAPFLAFCYTLTTVLTVVLALLAKVLPEVLSEGDWSDPLPDPTWLQGSEELAYLLNIVLSVGLVLALFVIAAIPSALTTWAIHRGGISRIIATAIVYLYGLVVLPLSAAFFLSRDAWYVFALNSGLALAALLFTLLGIGSVLSWSVRQSLREIRTMGLLMGRVLPVLMIVIVFAFFDASFWQVTREITGVRLTLVGIVFLAMGMAVSYPIGRRQLIGLLSEEAVQQKSPLTAGERINLVVVFVLAMFFQIVIFTFLTAVFLVVLGEIAFTPELISSWAGKDPSSARFLGLPLSVDASLLKTSVFLAFISSLNFLVSVATNKEYRDSFYGPILTRMRQALDLRSPVPSSGAGYVPVMEPDNSQKSGT